MTQPESEFGQGEGRNGSVGAVRHRPRRASRSPDKAAD